MQMIRIFMKEAGLSALKKLQDKFTKTWNFKVYYLLAFFYLPSDLESLQYGWETFSSFSLQPVVGWTSTLFLNEIKVDIIT